MSVTLEPKPPPVDDVERYWTVSPSQRSARCEYWLHRFEAGWRPNKRIRSFGYYEASEWYGVYIWEYINVLYAYQRDNHE